MFRNGGSSIPISGIPCLVTRPTSRVVSSGSTLRMYAAPSSRIGVRIFFGAHIIKGGVRGGQRAPRAQMLLMSGLLATGAVLMRAAEMAVAVGRRVRAMRT